MAAKKVNGRVLQKFDKMTNCSGGAGPESAPSCSDVRGAVQRSDPRKSLPHVSTPPRALIHQTCGRTSPSKPCSATSLGNSGQAAPRRRALGKPDTWGRGADRCPPSALGCLRLGWRKRCGEPPREICRPRMDRATRFQGHRSFPQETLLPHSRSQTRGASSDWESRPGPEVGA